MSRQETTELLVSSIQWGGGLLLLTIAGAVFISGNSTQSHQSSRGESVTSSASEEPKQTRPPTRAPRPLPSPSRQKLRKPQALVLQKDTIEEADSNKTEIRSLEKEELARQENRQIFAHLQEQLERDLKIDGLDNEKTAELEEYLTTVLEDNATTAAQLRTRCTTSTCEVIVITEGAPLAFAQTAAHVGMKLGDKHARGPAPLTEGVPFDSTRAIQPNSAVETDRSSAGPDAQPSEVNSAKTTRVNEADVPIPTQHSIRYLVDRDQLDVTEQATSLIEESPQPAAEELIDSDDSAE
ncbi:MAG: hypothetical protein MK135_08755 [Polyangiaceae bacterium]|nr:hypothetical protein [Polyangiaceae bacterium]